MECLQYLTAHGTVQTPKFVLNLVISGMPSIRMEVPMNRVNASFVLNLVISGMPSIHEHIYC